MSGICFLTMPGPLSWTPILYRLGPVASTGTQSSGTMPASSQASRELSTASLTAVRRAFLGLSKPSRCLFFAKNSLTDMSRCFAAMDSAVTARRFGCSPVLLTVVIFVCCSILPDFTLVTHEETCWPHASHHQDPRLVTKSRPMESDRQKEPKFPRSPVLGSDRNCSPLTGNPEVTGENLSGSVGFHADDSNLNSGLLTRTKMRPWRASSLFVFRRETDDQKLSLQPNWNWNGLYASRGVLNPRIGFGGKLKSVWPYK